MIQYQYCPHHPQYFATNLRQDRMTGNLIWDHARGQGTLLVQTPFGQIPTDKMEEICQAMGRTTLHPDKFTQVLANIWVRFMSAAEQVRCNGCPLNGEASTYTVFCYALEGDSYQIYAPQTSVMLQATYDVPLNIHGEVAPHYTTSGGIFRKKEVFSGFYTLYFPNGYVGGYQDGDLVYAINGLEIPITQAMLKQVCVYIQASDRPPEILSKNKGLKLI